MGIDIGGTFTDVVVGDALGIAAVAKRLTTTGDPADAALVAMAEALGRAGRSPGDVERVVHGTTLATNAILEHRGGRIALVTTMGFRHLLTLGRHARVEAERYDLSFAAPPPPVALADTYGVAERIGAAGEVLVPLADSDLGVLAARLEAGHPDGVAVCLINSYANPAHEEAVVALLRARLDVPVVASVEVSAEEREYERMMTTVMTVAIRPLMASYLSAFEARLVEAGVDAPFYVMESSGGMLSAHQAVERAVTTIESGPAAGVIAAAAAAGQAHSADVIAFDMGGTTAKAAVVTHGEPGLTDVFEVGGRGSFGSRRSGTGIPIRVPTIDLAEVGAGGGSIAWLDAQGTLQVGPASAGSDPGPACYGLGGLAPTVTDADVVLGYLSLRGSAQLPGFDPRLSEEAIRRHIAEPLGVAVEAAAGAIFDIANALMAGAIDVVTVLRGVDPRGYVLVCSGGAGPMHAARVAERFGIGRVMIPPAAGVLSAAGLLVADVRSDATATRRFGPGPDGVDALEDDLRTLEQSVSATLGAGPDVDIARSGDLRYRGQTHALRVPLGSPMTDEAWRTACEQFRSAHRSTYGVGGPGPVELARIRVRCVRKVAAPPIRRAAEAHAGPPGAARRAWTGAAQRFAETPLLGREDLQAGVRGPAIVEDPESTLYVPEGWRATLSEHGAVLLDRLGGR